MGCEVKRLRGVVIAVWMWDGQKDTGGERRMKR